MKGQVEIFGLLIVVILIVIGGLFYLKFAFLTETEEKTDDYSGQAYNLMNALLKLSICGNLSLKEAVLYCKEDNIGKDAYLCDGVDICQEVKQEILAVVEPFMDENNLNYAFFVKEGFNVDGGENLLVLNENDCKFGSVSPVYKFKVNEERYSAYFKLCKK